uniref:Thioredoxin domain-containing protein n=4 Tax=Meloidogyne TaxID=189290 RepID=A0A6V7VQL9_MELEN|nr:unnamed protein product [Meloidogyne enterolobii]CAD2180229.1 unnamed protein product [Meloidogyne enterolobii]
MSQTIKHPKSQEELNAILAEAGSKLVVIDFFATWCGPCRLMTPKFNKLADEFVDPIYVGIDVDEHEHIAANYEINVMPTFVFFKDGKKLTVIEGNNYEELRKTIESNK